MAQLGADVDQLDNMARDFRSAADELNNLIAKLGASVHAAWWQGPDADAFRGEWDGQFKTQLNNVATALTTTSEAVTQQANQQRQASGAG